MGCRAVAIEDLFEDESPEDRRVDGADRQRLFRSGLEIQLEDARLRGSALIDLVATCTRVFDCSDFDERIEGLAKKLSAP